MKLLGRQLQGVFFFVPSAQLHTTALPLVPPTPTTIASLNQVPYKEESSLRLHILSYVILESGGTLPARLGLIHQVNIIGKI